MLSAPKPPGCPLHRACISTAFLWLAAASGRTAFWVSPRDVHQSQQPNGPCCVSWHSATGCSWGLVQFNIMIKGGRGKPRSEKELPATKSFQLASTLPVISLSAFLPSVGKLGGVRGRKGRSRIDSLVLTYLTGNCWRVTKSTYTMLQNNTVQSAFCCGKCNISSLLCEKCQVNRGLAQSISWPCDLPENTIATRRSRCPPSPSAECHHCCSWHVPHKVWWRWACHRSMAARAGKWLMLLGTSCCDSPVVCLPGGTQGNEAIFTKNRNLFR